MSKLSARLILAPILLASSVGKHRVKKSQNGCNETIVGLEKNDRSMRGLELGAQKIQVWQCHQFDSLQCILDLEKEEHVVTI